MPKRSELLQLNISSQKPDLALTILGVNIVRLPAIEEADLAFTAIPDVPAGTAAKPYKLKHNRSWDEWFIFKLLPISRIIKAISQTEKFKETHAELNQSIDSLHDCTQYDIEWNVEDDAESNLFLKYLDPQNKKLKERLLTPKQMLESSAAYRIKVLSDIWSPEYVSVFESHLKNAQKSIQQLQKNFDKAWFASGFWGMFTFSFRNTFSEYREFKTRIKLREIMLSRAERELVIAKYETINQGMGLVPEATLKQYNQDIHDYLERHGWDLNTEADAVLSRKKAIAKKHNISMLQTTEGAELFELRSFEADVTVRLNDGWDAEDEIIELCQEENHKRLLDFHKKARLRLNGDQVESVLHPFFMSDAVKPYAAWCQFDDAINFFQSTQPASIDLSAIALFEYLRAKPSALDGDTQLFDCLLEILPATEELESTTWHLNESQRLLPKNFIMQNQLAIANDGAIGLVIKRILVPTLQQLMNHELGMQNIQASAYAEWLRRIDNWCARHNIQLNNLVSMEWHNIAMNKENLLKLIDLSNPGQGPIFKDTKERRIFARGALLKMVLDRNNDDAILVALLAHIRQIESASLLDIDKGLFELMIEIMPESCRQQVDGFENIDLPLTKYLNALIKKSVLILEKKDAVLRESERALEIVSWVRAHHFQGLRQGPAADILVRVNPEVEEQLDRKIAENIQTNKPWTHGMYRLIENYGSPAQRAAYYQNGLKQINDHLDKKEILLAQELITGMADTQTADFSLSASMSVLKDCAPFNMNEANTLYRFALLTNHAEYIANARIAAIQSMLKAPSSDQDLDRLDFYFTIDKNLQSLDRTVIDAFVKTHLLTQEKLTSHQVYLISRFASPETMHVFLRKFLISTLQGSDSSNFTGVMAVARMRLNEKITLQTGTSLLLPSDEQTQKSVKQMIFKVVKDELASLTERSTEEYLKTHRARTLRKAQSFVLRTPECHDGKSVIDALELAAWLRGDIGKLSSDTAEKLNRVLTMDQGHRFNAWETWIGHDRKLQKEVSDACKFYIEQRKHLWDTSCNKTDLIPLLDAELKSPACALVKMLAGQRAKFKTLAELWTPLNVRLLSREFVVQSYEQAETEFVKLFEKKKDEILIDSIQGHINALKREAAGFKGMIQNDGTLLTVLNVDDFIMNQKQHQDFALWQAKLHVLNRHMNEAIRNASGSGHSKFLGLQHQLLSLTNIWNTQDADGIYYEQLRVYLGNLLNGEPKFWHFATVQDWVPVLQRLVDYTKRNKGLSDKVMRALEFAIEEMPHMRAPLTCLKDLIMQGVNADGITEKRILVLHSFAHVLNAISSFDQTKNSDKTLKENLLADKKLLLDALLGKMVIAQTALQKGLKSVAEFAKQKPVKKAIRSQLQEAKYQVETFSRLIVMYSNEQVKDADLEAARLKDASNEQNSRKLTKMLPMFDTDMWPKSDERAELLAQELTHHHLINVLLNDQQVPSIGFISRLSTQDGENRSQSSDESFSSKLSIFCKS